MNPNEIPAESWASAVVIIAAVLTLVWSCIQTLRYIKCKNKETCPDCGCKEGEIHRDNCDVEMCLGCGGQYISCGCGSKLNSRMLWESHFTGVRECQEYGWYAKASNGLDWVSCGKDDCGATEDLNRLIRECIWSKELGRYIKEKKSNE